MPGTCHKVLHIALTEVGPLHQGPNNDGSHFRVWVSTPSTIHCSLFVHHWKEACLQRLHGISLTLFYSLTGRVFLCPAVSTIYRTISIGRGGLEFLFENKKRLHVDIPSQVVTLGDLINWVRCNLIRERHDMFMQGDHIRPGVLVLINDVDWELEDTTQYQVVGGDIFAFISTLHGG